MNKPVTMFGFQSMELFMLFLLLVGIAFITYSTGGIMVSLVFVIAYILVVVQIGKKITMESRKGNPNYIKGLISSMGYPKSIGDRYSVMETIRKSQKNG